MKKILIITLVFLNVNACQKLYDKGKKGDFTFRKCSNCKVSNN